MFFPIIQMKQSFQKGLQSHDKLGGTEQDLRLESETVEDLCRGFVSS